jgi:hypothetical protein
MKLGCLSGEGFIEIMLGQKTIHSARPRAFWLSQCKAVFIVPKFNLTMGFIATALHSL